MKTILSSLLAIGLALSGWSCGNEYGVTMDGRRVHTQFFYLTPKHKGFVHSALEKRLGELRSELASNPNDFRTKSNIALYHMKLGNVDSALSILQPLASHHPDEYTIVANLGTAYELAGELDSALKYISKGYEMNRRSHHGSEWIHIKILEAKIKAKGNRRWLRENRIITVEELEARMQHETRYLDMVNRHLFYQVRTRVPFTPAPNAVIFNLLLTIGDFNAKVGTYENALLSYGYALEFSNNSFWQTRLIEEKISELNKNRAKLEEKLHPMFLDLVKRSQLDPELLVLGLVDVAMELDSVDRAVLEKDDSIRMMQQQIDSMQNAASLSQPIEQAEDAQEDGAFRQSIWIYLIVGLGAGILGTVIFNRRSARKKHN